jgi:hypothetical protein
VATAGRGRGAREARERARVYQARQQLHQAQIRRRRRDNLLAGIVGGVVILAALGGQVAYFTAGPGAPEPSPSSTPGSSTEPTPSTVPTPVPTEPVPTEPAPADSGAPTP